MSIYVACVLGMGCFCEDLQGTSGFAVPGKLLPPEPSDARRASLLGATREAVSTMDYIVYLGRSWLVISW